MLAKYSFPHQRVFFSFQQNSALKHGQSTVGNTAVQNYINTSTPVASERLKSVNEKTASAKVITNFYGMHTLVRSCTCILLLQPKFRLIYIHASMGYVEKVFFSFQENSASRHRQSTVGNNAVQSYRHTSTPVASERQKSMYEKTASASASEKVTTNIITC